MEAKNEKYGIPDIHEVYRTTFRERMASLVDRDPKFLHSLLGYHPSKEAMHTAEALWAWLGSGEGENLREECMRSARERYDALLEERTRDIPVTVGMMCGTNSSTWSWFSNGRFWSKATLRTRWFVSEL